jgi:hypothetical protein
MIGAGIQNAVAAPDMIISADSLRCRSYPLQDVYVEGGKFSSYLKGKVSKGEIAPSVAQLAVTALVPAMIAPPASLSGHDRLVVPLIKGPVPCSATMLHSRL